MKKIIKESLKELIKDRYLLILILTMLVFAVVAAIVVGLSIRPSEIKVVSHYSAFGVTHYYKDQWLYLFSLVAFLLASAILHAAISIKLLIEKGHSLAVMFAWTGIVIVSLGLIMSISLLNFRAFL